MVIIVGLESVRYHLSPVTRSLSLVTTERRVREQGFLADGSDRTLCASLPPIPPTAIPSCPIYTLQSSYT